ncbi:MAG TPA: hypothetical protein PLK94_02880 [Alphaproteobacteria bacterium]|nr:hypothetical protein [Alphaproteobacteria bacterium]HOO50213.1 hypothetical protein [Alphaproteobacteria bacterium]
MKKWIIRILITIIVFCGIFVGGLKLISGTGDVQKGGLESAFGESFGGVAHIGTLEAFNVFPDVTVQTSKLSIEYGDSVGDIHAEYMGFSFGMIDLLLQNRHIKDFTIKNMFIVKGRLFNQNVYVRNASIKSLENEPSAFAASGTYADIPFTFQISMLKDASSLPPSFTFDKENPFEISIGTVKIKGTFTPFAKDNATLANLEILQNGIACTSLPKTNKFTVMSFTNYVFSEISKIELERKDLNEACKSITRYGL